MPTLTRSVTSDALTFKAIENNKKKSNDEKNSYGVVKNAQVTDVREPRLYMYNKILVSESGATFDFFTEFRDVKISFSFKPEAFHIDIKSAVVGILILPDTPLAIILIQPFRLLLQFFLLLMEKRNQLLQ